MKFSASLALLVISFSAFSAKALTKTEANMSPDESQVQITLGASLLGGNVSYDGGGSATLSGYGIPAMIYYGFDNSNAIGIEDGFTHTEAKTSAPGFADSTSKVDGMSDVTISYLGNYDLAGTTLFVKLGAQIPTQNNKEDSSTNTTSTASGQPGIIATVGMVFPTPNLVLGNIGFLLSREFLFEGNADFTDANGVSQSGKVKDGGSYTITAFIEGASSIHPYLQISYASPLDTTFTRNDGTSYTTGSVDNLMVTGSLTFEVVQGVEIIPALMYATALNKNKINASSYDLYAGMITARLTF